MVRLPWRGYPSAFPLLEGLISFSRRRVWNLNGVDGIDIHRLALRDYLSDTRYAQWTGIFESLYFLLSAPGGPFIFPPPGRHAGANTDPGEVDMNDDDNDDDDANENSNDSDSPRITRLSPDTEPFLRINRFAKAWFEFMKSMRLFMRAAICHRQSTSSDADRNNFWVAVLRNPCIQDNICAAIVSFMESFFDTEVYVVDYNLNSMPTRIDTPKRKLIFNLLEGESHSYRSERHMLNALYCWMFSGQAEGMAGYNRARPMVNRMIEEGQLVDPYMVSYFYPIAHSYPEMKEMGYSPSITPTESDALGEIGFQFNLDPPRSDDEGEDEEPEYEQREESEEGEETGETEDTEIIEVEAGQNDTPGEGQPAGGNIENAMMVDD